MERNPWRGILLGLSIHGPSPWTSWPSLWLFPELAGTQLRDRVMMVRLFLYTSVDGDTEHGVTAQCQNDIACMVAATCPVITIIAIMHAFILFWGATKHEALTLLEK